MTITKIIARVQKLLEVSRSENEHEAANAAARAAKLIEEYQLSEAMLRIHDHTVKPDAIVDGVRLMDETKKRVAWKESIASAVAESLGCKMYLAGGTHPTCYGRESATQTWSYTCQYLFREVDRLADEAWEREGAEAKSVGQTIKKWKNAFRVGAATTIAVRLHQQAAEAKAERTRKVEAFTQEVIEQERHTGGFRPNDSTETSQALVLVDQDEREVESAYAERSKGFRSCGSIGKVASRSGYHAGREAGESVRLGGARAGLGAGQGCLP